MSRRRNREQSPDKQLRPMTDEADPESGDSEWNESIGEDDD
jgi:hypothetical protein